MENTFLNCHSRSPYYPPIPLQGPYYTPTPTIPHLYHTIPGPLLYPHPYYTPPIPYHSRSLLSQKIDLNHSTPLLHHHLPITTMNQETNPSYTMEGEDLYDKDGTPLSCYRYPNTVGKCTHCGVADCDPSICNDVGLTFCTIDCGTTFSTCTGIY